MTPAQYSALDAMAHFASHDMALCTNRQIRKRDAERLVSLGFAESTLCVIVDDDGFYPDNEKWANGYTLTKAGREAYLAERERRLTK